MPSIAEEVKEEPSKSSKKLTNTKIPIAVGKFPVSIEADKIFFPPVKVGGSSKADVKLKNYNNSAKVILIDDLGSTSAFKCTHKEVQVLPKHFMKIPIVFSPRIGDSNSGHTVILTLRDKRNPDVKASVTLRGSVLKNCKN